MAKSKPPVKKTQVVNHTVHQTATFSGPLPPPQILSGYDEICPGFAERILKTYENEVEHRHEMERHLVATEANVQGAVPREILTGQILAFLICIGFLSSGTFLIYSNHEISGTIFGGGGLAGIVGAFLSSRKTRSESQSQ